MYFNANEKLGTGFPPDEGKNLAELLLQKGDVTWDDLEIDLSALPAALLISAFFNGFLQKIHDKRPDLLSTCRKIHWRVAFEFQKSNIDRWMKDFTPRTS